MMNRFLRLMVIVFCLTVPVAMYGQSSSKLYEKGETLMQSGKYNDAINAFNAAMQMDSDLETSCKAKIRQCQEKISQRAKAKEKSSSSSYSLTINKEVAEFGCETMTPVQIKVSSQPKEWEAKSDASWCTVTASGNLASINCEVNKSVSSRNTTVVFSNGYTKAEVMVVQGGQQPFIKLEYESVVFPKQGGLAELKVNSNTEWEIYQIPDWCTIVSSGDEVIVLKADEFKSGRQGTLIVKTKEGGELASAIITQDKKKKVLGLF